MTGQNETGNFGSDGRLGPMAVILIATSAAWLGFALGNDQVVEIVNGYQAQDMQLLAEVTSAEFEDDLREMVETISRACKPSITPESPEALQFRPSDRFPECEMSRRDSFSYDIRCST